MRTSVPAASVMKGVERPVVIADRPQIDGVEGRAKLVKADAAIGKSVVGTARAGALAAPRMPVLGHGAGGIVTGTIHPEQQHIHVKVATLGDFFPKQDGVARIDDFIFLDADL